VQYAVTEQGREELAEWFTTPVRRESRPRDELAIKLALAVTAPAVDVRAVLQAQRTDSMRALQDYTRLKVRADEGDLAWLLVLDALVFQTEAEVRWLDHCESRLVRASAAGPGAAATRLGARPPRSGPAASGPAASGPAASGPAASDPAASGSATRSQARA